MGGQEYVGKFKWPVTVQLEKGLEGAITNATKIGYIDGEKGRLIYRGYDIVDLVKYSNFEETAYLLILGELPTKKQLSRFDKKLKKNREVPQAVINLLKSLPRTTHPMDSLRTGISLLGCLDKKAGEPGVENAAEIGIKLIAKMATVAGAIARMQEGEEPLTPDKSLGHAANFLYLMTGKKPDKFFSKIMDVSLILHADHGMNPSTLTAMVISSSLSDLYSSVVGGIGSLKGPLHGGANEKALTNLLKLKNVSDAENYVKDCVVRKEKIMGFGHRVYKTYDPRAKILKQYAKKLLKAKRMEKFYEITEEVEKEVIKIYGKKGIFPNVDFYSGIVYYAMGIKPSMFTPIFAVSRIVGWVARVLEYLPENRIFRPRAIYVGSLEKKYKPLQERK